MLFYMLDVDKFLTLNDSNKRQVIIILYSSKLSYEGNWKKLTNLL